MGCAAILEGFEVRRAISVRALISRMGRHVCPQFVNACADADTKAWADRPLEPAGADAQCPVSAPIPFLIKITRPVQTRTTADPDR
jgi:hypothetical protein